MKNAKSLLSIILAVLMVASMIVLPVSADDADVWDGTPDTSWYNETDTEFTLTTAKQLAGLASLVNGGNTFEGKTVKLGADIKLNDTTDFADWGTSAPANVWVTIGAQGSGIFMGIFDGQNYTISGMYAKADGTENDSDPTSGKRAALFGKISGATIKNLNIEDAYSQGIDAAAIVVGYIEDSKVETISNVHIDNCYVKNTTDGSVAAFVSKTGSTPLKVVDCSVTGTLDGAGRVAAVLGNYSGGTAYELEVTNFKSNMDIKSSAKSVGGIIGLVSNATPVLTNVRVEGTITSKGGYTGGLIGDVAKPITITFTGCAMLANVRSDGARVGGLIGNINQNNYEVNVEDCYVEADIQGTEYVSSMVGYISHERFAINVKNTVVFGSLKTTAKSAAAADIGVIVGRIGTADSNYKDMPNKISVDNLYYDVDFSGEEGVKVAPRLGSFVGYETSKVFESEDCDTDAFSKCVFYTPLADKTSEYLGSSTTKNNIKQSTDKTPAEVLEALTAELITYTAIYDASHDHVWGKWEGGPENFIRYCTLFGCTEFEEKTEVVVAVCTCRGRSDWSAWKVATLATCDTDGTSFRTCKGCGVVEWATVAASHKWGEWTVDCANDTDHDGYVYATRVCYGTCGDTEVGTELVSAGHKTIWVTTAAPTASTPGTESLICQLCHQTLDTRNISELGEGEVTPIIPAEPSVPTYTDIVGHKYQADIELVTAYGLFNGMGGGLFQPETTMTRGMIVTVLARLAKVDVTSYKNNFTDVADDSYYAPYVGWAEAVEITNGYGDGTFRPDEEITKEQAISMIARYFKHIDVKDTTSNNGAGFTDLGTASDWAKADIAELIRLGIIENDTTTFRPTADATRGELANFFANVLQYLMK